MVEQIYVPSGVAGDEAALIHDALQLADCIQYRPVERLLPHIGNIKSLYVTVDRLYQSLSDQTPRASPAKHSLLATTPRLDGPSISNLSAETSRSTKRKARGRQVTASDALRVACQTASYLDDIILEHFTVDQHLWLGPDADPRTAHLQSILSLQKATASTQSNARDRLLLACSCHSLARDFQQFERSQGWTSTEEILQQRILSSQATHVQRHGKHHSNFFSQMRGQDLHREKLDAGLRLGTKMRLIATIGKESSIGCGLELLLGYECHKLSRLSYKELALLAKRLGNEKVGELEPIRAFCRQFSDWWRKTVDGYHNRYGLFACATGSSTAQTYGNAGAEAMAVEAIAGDLKGTQRIAGTRMLLNSSQLEADQAIGMSPATAAMFGDAMWFAQNEDISRYTAFGGIPGQFS